MSDTLAPHNASSPDIRYSDLVSRGHGVRERQVLDYLRRYETVCAWLHAPGTYASVAAIAGEESSRSAVESVRRACKALAAAGLIELTRDGPAAPLLARLSVEDGIDASTGQHLAPLPWE